MSISMNMDEIMELDRPKRKEIVRSTILFHRNNTPRIGVVKSYGNKNIGIAVAGMKSGTTISGRTPLKKIEVYVTEELFEELEELLNQ